MLECLASAEAFQSWNPSLSRCPPSVGAGCFSGTHTVPDTPHADETPRLLSPTFSHRSSMAAKPGRLSDRGVVERVGGLHAPSMAHVGV